MSVKLITYWHNTSFKRLKQPFETFKQFHTDDVALPATGEFLIDSQLLKFVSANQQNCP